MKLSKLFLFTLILITAVSCSTYQRTPAQKNCAPDTSTNAGTHFDDYERCNDL